MKFKTINEIDIIQIIISIILFVILKYTQNIYIIIGVVAVFIISVIVDFSEFGLRTTIKY